MELMHTAKRISLIRKVGWLSVASMLALALLAPGTALAGGPGSSDNLPNSGHTSNTGGVTPTMVKDAVMTCDQSNVVSNVSGHFTIDGTGGAGTYVIIYLTPNNGSDADPALTEDNEVKVSIDGLSGTVSFSLNITTGFTTTKGGVLAVFAMDTDGSVFTSKSNSLNCTEGTTTTSTSSTSSSTSTSSSSTSTSTTTEASSTTTVASSTSTEASSTSTEASSTTTEASSTSTEASSTSTEASSTTTQASSTTETIASSTSTSGTQSVEGETDAPTPAITLPPTDTLTGPSGPSNDSWRIMLIAGAALLASVLVLSPAKASRRR
jgi:hypothetical protein